YVALFSYTNSVADGLGPCPREMTPLAWFQNSDRAPQEAFAPENSSYYLNIQQGMQLVVETHYINGSTIPGLREAWIDMQFEMPSDNSMAVQPFVATASGTVPDGTMGKVSGSCASSSPVRILMLSGALQNAQQLTVSKVSGDTRTIVFSSAHPQQGTA